MIKQIIIVGALLALITATSAHADNQGKFGASGAFHFKNSSLMLEGRYVKQISLKTLIAPAIAYDFDLEEVVLDLNFQILNPGTRYYGLGGINYTDSDSGLNIGMGMNFKYNEKTQGYGEIKYIFFGWSGFVLNVGVYF
ncbi:hypothetical protein [Kaarinaea lacus]